MKQLVALLHRHGETPANKKKVFRGRSDGSLDEVGLRQAEEAAMFLARYDVGRIVSSPLRRAYETALAVQRVFSHIPVEQERSLFPWDVGFITGRDREEYRDLLEFYVANPGKRPPEGEALAEAEKRVDRYFERELEYDPDELTCYVTHTSVITIFYGLVTGVKTIRPGLGEIVSPGGIVGVFATERGMVLETVYGETKANKDGIS